MNIKDIEKYGVDSSVVEEYINKIKNGDKIIAVAGEFSSGKSTFINAYLNKKDFIPSAIKECTPVLLGLVNTDKDWIEITYKDGNYKKVENTLANLEKYAINSDDYDKNIVSVSIPYKSEYIPYDTHIVDTPGSNTIHKEHSEITNMILKKADIVLYIIKVSLSQVDINNIRQIMEYSSQIIFIVSNMDEKAGDIYINSNNERIDKCISVIEAELKDKLDIENADILPIGSLAYYNDDSLMKEIRECIKFGIETNKTQVLKNRVKKQLKYMLKNKYNEMKEKYEIFDASTENDIEKLEKKYKLLNEKIKRNTDNNVRHIKFLDEKVKTEMKHSVLRLEELFDKSADKFLENIKKQAEITEDFLNKELKNIADYISNQYKEILEESINKLIENIYSEKDKELKNTFKDLNLDFSIDLHSPDLEELDMSEIDDRLFELREEKRRMELEIQKAEAEISVTKEENEIIQNKLYDVNVAEEEVIYEKRNIKYNPQYVEVIEEGYGEAGKRIGRIFGEAVDFALIFLNPEQGAVKALQVADRVKDGTKMAQYFQRSVQAVNKFGKATSKQKGRLKNVLKTIDWLSVGKYTEILGEKVGSSIKPEKTILVEDEQVKAQWEEEKNEINEKLNSIRQNKVKLENDIANGEISIMQAKRKMNNFIAEIQNLEKKKEDVEVRLKKQAERDSRTKVIDYYYCAVHDKFEKQKESSINTLEVIMNESYKAIVEKCNVDFSKKIQTINESLKSIINDRDNKEDEIKLQKQNIEEFKNYEQWVDEWIQ